MPLTTNDYLEVRDTEGKPCGDEPTPVTSIEGDIVSTYFGKFRITGQRNISGAETYEHIALDGGSSFLHAVKASKRIGE